MKEFQFLKHHSDHPNILKVFSHSSNGMLAVKGCNRGKSSNDYNVLGKGFDYIAMEYCPNGDLFDIIKRTGKLS